MLAQIGMRVPDLVPLRHGRMAASPWNFYRGAAAVMATDLATSPNSGLPVQLCGDAHVLNFGLWATPERNLSFDLRDFDETLPRPLRVGRDAPDRELGGRGPGERRPARWGGRCRRVGTPGLPVEDARLRRRLADGDLVRQHLRRQLLGYFGEDRRGLFLQVKQAGPSVYEAHLGPSRYDNHGARVVNGKRLIQSATDILVGWTSFDDMDFYVRQFRDMKVIPDAERIAPVLKEFATACGEVLVRAHARTGDPVAIASYIGKGKRFDEAIAGFARAYADQTEHDHAQLVAAIADGVVPAESG
jgi:hypothetical protein